MRLLPALLLLLVAHATRAQITTFGNGSLTARWELEDSLRHGAFLPTPHKPVYLLVGNWSSNPNRQPRTFKSGSTLPQPMALQDTEAKFQFSFKFKCWQGIFGEHGDLWMAYTQSSRWQVYNADASRPFRETNYEPELILNFATDVDLHVLGLRLRMLGGGLNHQSNGNSLFLTRSWNRLIAQVGLERPHWALILRPWYRLPEPWATDENPHIERYLGHGDLLITHQHGRHDISLLGRHNLARPGRGSFTAYWSFGIHPRFNAHLQVFHGYGESLLDYNHRQTTVGVGFALIDWM